MRWMWALMLLAGCQQIKELDLTDDVQRLFSSYADADLGQFPVDAANDPAGAANLVMTVDLTAGDLVCADMFGAFQVKLAENEESEPFELVATRGQQTETYNSQGQGVAGGITSTTFGWDDSESKVCTFTLDVVLEPDAQLTSTAFVSASVDSLDELTDEQVDSIKLTGSVQ